MMTRKLWLAALLGIPIAAVVCGRVVLDGACQNDPIAEAVSPDGKRKAVAFRRHCGATTGFSTQVSVVASEDSTPSGRGNVFVADTNHGAAPADAGGGPRVDIEWSSASRLVIRHHPAARVFAAETERAGVAIVYSTAP